MPSPTPKHPPGTRQLGILLSRPHALDYYSTRNSERRMFCIVDLCLLFHSSERARKVSLASLMIAVGLLRVSTGPCVCDVVQAGPAATAPRGMRIGVRKITPTGPPPPAAAAGAQPAAVPAEMAAVLARAADPDQQQLQRSFLSMYSSPDCKVCSSALSGAPVGDESIALAWRQLERKSER